MTSDKERMAGRGRNVGLGRPHWEEIFRPSLREQPPWWPNHFCRVPRSSPGHSLWEEKLPCVPALCAFQTERRWSSTGSHPVICLKKPLFQPAVPTQGPIALPTANPRTTCAHCCQALGPCRQHRGWCLNPVSTQGQRAYLQSLPLKTYGALSSLYTL